VPGRITGDAATVGCFGALREQIELSFGDSAVADNALWRLLRESDRSPNPPRLIDYVQPPPGKIEFRLPLLAHVVNRSHDARHSIIEVSDFQSLIVQQGFSPFGQVEE
jgi:hypothetical protein